MTHPTSAVAQQAGRWPTALGLVAVLGLLCVPLFVGLSSRDFENDEAIYSYAVDGILDTGELAYTAPDSVRLSVTTVEGDLSNVTSVWLPFSDEVVLLLPNEFQRCVEPMKAAGSGLETRVLATGG